LGCDKRQAGLSVLALVTEAYGGFGGVSVCSIDLMDAICELPYVSSVTLVPRVVRENPNGVPRKVELVTEAAAGIGAFVWEVTKLMRRKFDIVVSAHIHLLPFTAFVTARYRTPVICVLHGVEAWSPTKRPLVNHIVRRRCDSFISVSNYTERRFREWSKVAEDRIALLPNCVHTERYGMGEKPTYLVDRYNTRGCRVIMTLGRLDARERQKGVDEVIEAMPRLLVDSPDLRYLIAGDGDDRPRLEAKVGQLGLRDKIVFSGRVDDKEKVDHYRLCDAFSMAGRQEGFGIVLLEALACGAPVVASELDGSRDAILNGELGELANPDDPASLRAALLRALAKPRHVPERLDYFSFENSVKRLDKIVRPYLGGCRSMARGSTDRF
jgi:phosphatidylinositol alpha-1,6-mannosyltransferase